MVSPTVASSTYFPSVFRSNLCGNSILLLRHAPAIFSATLGPGDRISKGIRSRRGFVVAVAELYSNDPVAIIDTTFVRQGGSSQLNVLHKGAAHHPICHASGKVTRLSRWCLKQGRKQHATPGIWTMNIDGSGLRELLPANRFLYAAWSPDGLWVAAIQQEAPTSTDAPLVGNGLVGGFFQYTNY